MVIPEPGEYWQLVAGSPYGPVNVFVLCIGPCGTVQVDYNNYVRSIPLSDFATKLS
jgi:hypothetical protein